VRQEQDKIFQQMMGIHQETVDSYLENILTETVDHVSSEQAKKQVQEYAEKLSQLEECTVENLVSSFLIPNVERQVVQQERILI
jgi:hypothetical protein